MKHLSDGTLWNIVHQPLDASIDRRLRKLTEQAKARDLSISERRKLDALLKEYNAHVLKRSEAMLALQQRGYDVLAVLKAQEDER